MRRFASRDPEDHSSGPTPCSSVNRPTVIEITPAPLAAANRATYCQPVPFCHRPRLLRVAAAKRSLLSELAEVGLRELDDLVGLSGEDGPGGVEREALCLLEGDLGRH